MKKLFLIILGCLAFACEQIIPGSPADNEILDGPLEDLTTAEQAQFLAGDLAFNEEVFTANNGLGPLFVATSCGSCHAGDGKGHPFTTLTRFGQTAPNTLPNLSIGGPQLQNRALPGYIPEKLPDGVPFMKMTPPAVTGLGLLSALTDDQILANADPSDLDGDGISGVPNYVFPPAYFIPQAFHQKKTDRYIGRFGKKAAAIDLLQQTVSAYNQDMGIISTFEPVDPSSGLTLDPEVSDQTIRDVVFYLRTLKAPLPRSPVDQQVIQGKVLFSQIQCDACHISEWKTPTSDIAAISNKTFFPYTDLLLHDMGPELDDGATEGSAETYEWRTPPLWGLGLSPNSQGGSYFLMHDGRATSIEEAILLHGGEATDSRAQFESLSAKEKDAILRFLKSL
ncbi:di-heme oxidoredictase family protein [Algoriphagus persicinus]|uniref:di-heme oxidoredictase family protein n=1 Tax=Algoriphagus persicinus TaxID=3108754 RepID=UPI002B382437|nr:di-heme oxidoredictase family protein [Algoriphagus sp. E1-3-M2]MEB2787077.1 di-heme oxidoredictase family protein [Algoriphagus sp. E1-3-M2]